MGVISVISKIGKAISSIPNLVKGNAGLASGIAGALGSAGNMWFEANQASKQRDWSEQMATKQNQWNIEQWNRQNEYNSPAAQKARLEEAGLNPLYFGVESGLAQPLESAQPQPYDRASASAFTNPLQSGLDAYLLNAQVENTRANTAKTNQESLTEVQRRENMTVELDKIKQEIQNMVASQEFTEAETRQINKALEWIDRINAANLAYTESQTKLNESTRNRIDSLLEGEKLLQAKTIEDFDRQWSKIDAEIKKIAAETNILYEDLANYAINHYSSGFMGSGMSTTNVVRAVNGLFENILAKRKAKKEQSE